MTSKLKPKQLVLERAIRHLQSRGETVGFSAVARLVGVTPALIHNTYPDIADHIRKVSGKTPKAQKDDARKELVTLRQSNAALRGERDALVADNRKLASLNETLRFELARSQSLVNGTVTPIKGGGTGRSQLGRRPCPGVRGALWILGDECQSAGLSEARSGRVESSKCACHAREHKAETMSDMQSSSIKAPHGPKWQWSCTRTESDDRKRVTLVYAFQLPGPNQRPVLRTVELPLDPAADRREVMQAVADRIVDEDVLSP